MTSRTTALVLAGSFVAACAGAPAATPTPNVAWANQGPREVVPIVVSSELAVGANRFLLNVVDRQNKPLAQPTTDAALNYWDLADTRADAPAISAHGTYLTVLPTLPGLYRADVTFPHAGQWGLELFLTDAAKKLEGRVSFPVRDTTSTPALGAPAPATDTPTATTTDAIHAVSTDQHPDPDFYRTSVKQALADHLPFLLIFATPAFCRSATCGPALDVVKSVAADYKGRVTFIHVEPYQLKIVGNALQPVFDSDNNLVPIQATVDWGLPTEPYTFAVDSDGKVRAKLEGVAAPDELRQALDLIASARPSNSASP